MIITVILTNGIVPTPSIGLRMKMVIRQVKYLLQFYPNLVFVREATNGRWHLTRSFRSTTFWKGWGRKASLFRLRRLAG